MTIRYSLPGTGPKKSMCNLCHSLDGIGCIRRGSGTFCGPTA